MIRRVFLLVFLLSLSMFSRAQENGVLGLGIGSMTNYYAPTYKGKVYRSAGIGAGGRVTYERTLKTLKTGSLTLGGMLVFGQSDRDAYYNTWKSKHRWRHTVLAARVAYLYPYDANLSLYGGLNLGMHFLSFKEVYKTAPPAGYSLENYNVLSRYAGLFVGADYKFDSRLSVFGELGVDLMWFTIGAKLYL